MRARVCVYVCVFVYVAHGGLLLNTQTHNTYTYKNYKYHTKFRNISVQSVIFRFFFASFPSKIRQSFVSFGHHPMFLGWAAISFARVYAINVFSLCFAAYAIALIYHFNFCCDYFLLHFSNVIYSYNWCDARQQTYILVKISIKHTNTQNTQEHTPTRTEHTSIDSNSRVFLNPSALQSLQFDQFSCIFPFCFS